MTHPGLHTNWCSALLSLWHLELERLSKGEEGISKEQVEYSRDRVAPLHSHYNFPFPITSKPQEEYMGRERGVHKNIHTIGSVLKLKKKLEAVCIRLFINLFTKYIKHQLVREIMYLRTLEPTGGDMQIDEL